MKKTIFLMFIGMIACLTANAETTYEIINNNENVEAVNTTTDMRLAVSYPTMAYPEMSFAPASTDEGYKTSHDWKSARTLRNIGCGVCLVGCAGLIAGITVEATAVTNSMEGDVMTGIRNLSTGVSVIIASSVPLIAGAIMWGIGNHKMKKARLSYTGNGLTYNF